MDDFISFCLLLGSNHPLFFSHLRFRHTFCFSFPFNQTMVKDRVHTLYSMASSTSYDLFCQEANTLHWLCVLIIGRFFQTLFFISIYSWSNHGLWQDSTIIFRGLASSTWLLWLRGKHPFVTFCIRFVKGVTSLGLHIRPACNQAPLEIFIKKMIFFTVKLCVYVLFPMRSREQSDDVSYANESRDPLKQYPYCLSRALIG